MYLDPTASEAEIIYYVYVVNESNQLTGVFSLRDLITAEPGQPIEEIMQTRVISVNVRTDQEEVARLVAKYDFWPFRWSMMTGNSSALLPWMIF